MTPSDKGGNRKSHSSTDVVLVQRWIYRNGPIRGRNVQIDLRKPDYQIEPSALQLYDLSIEVVPAWHDDVVGKTSAIGLKFHLYAGSGPSVGIVGYTSDTGAYGLEPNFDKLQQGGVRIDDQYADCTVLIAHLGDIRLRELASMLKAGGREWHINSTPHPVIELLRSTFAGSMDKEMVRGKIREFLELLIVLDLTPAVAFEAPLLCDGGMYSVQDWLSEYLAGSQSEGLVRAENRLGALDYLVDYLSTHGVTSADLEVMRAQVEPAKNHAKQLKTDAASELAYTVLEFLVLSSLASWKYEFHLGAFGTYRLFERMAKRWSKHGSGAAQPVFIVGELPEELTSYRHAVAHLLNLTEANRKDSGLPNLPDRVVHAFTGDIGLHVQLDLPDSQICPKIRCTYCNYNIELVCKGWHYHAPSSILETPLKRLGGQMIYLCTEKDHHPENIYRPRHFLNRPELRVI